MIHFVVALENFFVFIESALLLYYYCERVTRSAKKYRIGIGLYFKSVVLLNIKVLFVVNRSKKNLVDLRVLIAHKQNVQ